jgi:pyridoxal phosphate enzyme (YggS family)
MKLHSISKNVAATRASVIAAAQAAGRDPDEIHLVAVSKKKPAADIEAAYAAGLTDIGENYLQEAIDKIHALAHLPLTWHFIGAIQSNKTRPIAEHFHWVHTIERGKIARRLSEQCPPGKTLDACLQVNIDADPAKAGVSPDNAAKLLDEVAGLPNLRVRGLMTILETGADPLASYQRLAALFADLAERGVEPWDTLSMGMSKDYAQAIMAGATHVRIGTDIFGPRDTADEPT